MANINRDKPTINKMSEEDTGIEKQIINMIKNVLVDEEYEDEKKNEKEVKFNFKLLDLSSPVYQRKEKRSYHLNSDNQLVIPQNRMSNLPSDNSEISINSTINETKKIGEEKIPWEYGVFPALSYSSTQTNLGLTSIINQNTNNLNLNANNYFPYDYQNIIINSSFNSTNSSVFLDNASLLKKQRTPRVPSNENLKLLIDSDDLESKMLSLEFIDDEIYEKLKGSFLEIITNQNCSRILQNCLQTMSTCILSKILYEVAHKIPDLMIDLYANYFFQKFYGYLTDADRVFFMTRIKSEIVSIANNKIGTYPLQAVIDKMKTPEEKDILVDAIKFNVLEMCQDQNGVHVIEKMILCFSENEIQIIYEVLIDYFEILANNANGLCVAKLIILCKKPENMKKLHSKIVNNALSLVQNPYGNYAIQKALENWKNEEAEPLIIQFCNKFYDLSKHKYSSNAVEKSLDRGGEIIMAKFIDEISYMNRVVELMKNEYGNFVIQKALKLSQNLNRKRLVKLIQKNVDKIGDKKLVVKWKNIVNSFINTNCILNRVNGPFVLGCGMATTPSGAINYNNFTNSGLSSPFSINDQQFLFSPQYMSTSNIPNLNTMTNNIKKSSSTANVVNSNVIPSNQSNSYYSFYDHQN